MQFYVNAVRKLPLTRAPYLHVLWAGAGASFGAWLVDFEERTEKELAGEELTYASLRHCCSSLGRLHLLSAREWCACC